MQDTLLGIVLFAHGSRDERWRAPVEAVASRMALLDPSVRIECAYLELVAPDLHVAVDALVRHGATTVRVVPLFLGMGKHVREDLPLLIDALRSAHPRLAFDLRPAVGETPEVIDLLARVALNG